MSTKVAMYINQDCLIVPIQTELRNKVLERMQKDILEKVREAQLRGVIIDLSAVSLLDTYQARKIIETAKMTEILGTVTVFTGFSAGIAISLIELGFEADGIHTAISMEKGEKLLASMLK